MTNYDRNSLPHHCACNSVYFYPPCRVDTNSTVSLGCRGYPSSPSSSQSASLMSTNIPGRLLFFPADSVFPPRDGGEGGAYTVPSTTKSSFLESAINVARWPTRYPIVVGRAVDGSTAGSWRTSLRWLEKRSSSPPLRMQVRISGRLVGTQWVVAVT